MKRSKKQRLGDIPETISAFPLWGMVAVLAWTAFVALWFFKQAKIPVGPILDQWQNSPWAVLPTFDASLRHTKHLAALAGVTIALLAIGRRLLRLAGVKLHNAWETLALSFGLGYGAAGTALLLLGLAGLWPRSLLLGLLAGALALASFDAWSLYRAEPAPPSAAAERFDIPGLWAITGVVFVWLCTARHTLIPETFYDALQYHLGLPSMFLQHGRIFPTPEISYSGIPGLPQMLYGWTLALDSWGVTAYLLHHSIVLWVGVGMIGYCRRIGRASAGPMAAAAFFLVPVVLTESFSVSVGMEWALLELCWFASLTYALAEPPDSADRKAWLALAGAFLGFTMATKYQAWLLPAAMVPLLFMKFAPAPEPGAAPEPGRLHGATVKEVLLVLCVAAACLAPWVLKNVWFYKNPLYPFFHEFFVGKADFIPNWRGMAAGGMSKNYSLLSLSGWASYAAFPARFLFLKDIFQSTGLVVACLAPLVFWARLSDSERLLAWTALAAWVTLSLLTEITRYFIPHLALATLLICCLIAHARPVAFKKTLLSVAGACCAVYGLLWVGLAVDQTKLGVYMGKKSFGEYLTHYVVSYVSPPYSGIEYVNERTPKDSGVILYGEPRGFYLRRRYRTASDDNPSLLEIWADRSAAPEELRSRLKAEKLDYVLINLSEMERRRLWGNVPPATLSKLAAFWKRYAVKEFEVKVYPERWLAVYRLLDETEASRPRAPDPLFEDLLKRFAISK